MAAQIINGRWTRRVPASWYRNGVARSDILKTVLADPSLIEAAYVLPDGSQIVIPAVELRRILSGGSDHYGEKIWGPFNIDSIRKTVADEPCQMSRENAAPKIK